MAFGLTGEQGAPRLSYGSYLRVPDLTSLQVVQSDPPQHDELLFIIVHQVYELWFKQLIHELDAVTGRLAEGQALGAHRLLRRCTEIQRVLIAQLKVLETMTPNDFLTFRDRLMPASGFQSAQFRVIEFMAGARHRGHLDSQAVGSAERAELERRLGEPTLGDAFYELLRGRGFELPRDDEAAGGAEAARERRIQELLRIYQAPDDHYDLYLLAEALVDFDESFMLWRVNHVAMVERMIGSKPGTGGSDGVSYLKRTVERKFFPELWELRTHLGGQQW
jgi:tryptophan 2,3-dioxygenase